MKEGKWGMKRRTSVYSFVSIPLRWFHIKLASVINGLAPNEWLCMTTQGDCKL